MVGLMQLSNRLMMYAGILTIYMASSRRAKSKRVPLAINLVSMKNGLNRLHPRWG